MSEAKPLTVYISAEDDRGAGVLRASARWVRDLWAFRELLYFFALRDIKLRYRQTALGAAWAVIQPLFTMVIFAVLFGGVMKVSTDGIPAPVFYYAALLP